MAKRRKEKPQKLSSGAASGAPRPSIPTYQAPPPAAAATGGCAVVFFGLFSAAVFAVFLLIAWFLLGPTWDVRQRFVETTGEIVSARIREEVDGDVKYYPEMFVRFTPAGQPRREVWTHGIPPRVLSRHPAAWEVLDRWPIGASVPCWYDPADPQQVTLSGDWHWGQLVVLGMPLAALGLVLYCLRHAWRRWGLSPEAAAQGSPEIYYVFLPVGAFLLFCSLGLFSAIVFDTILPEHRAANSYVETTCVVLDSRMLKFRGSKTTNYRPEFKIRYQTPAFPDPVETWIYRALDANAGSIQLDAFQKGKTYPCWYDPERPRWVVLDRSIHWSTYLQVFLPLLPLAPAALLLTYSIRGLRAPHNASATDTVWRAFPSAAPRAGRRLAYRFTARGSLWREFWQFVVFTVGWNIVAWAFAVGAIANRMRGRPEWFLTIFSGFLVFFGALVLFATVSKFFAALRTPPAELELSHWPLLPGRSFQFYATQGGRLPLVSLVLTMVCEESTTFREGTSTRVETTRVFARELLRREGSGMAATPREVEGAWTVPHSAMHSFKTRRSSITWKIVIEAGFPGSDSIETEIVVPVGPRQKA